MKCGCEDIPQAQQKDEDKAEAEIMDPNTASMKELKQFLIANNESTEGLLEKSELRQKVLEIQKKIQKDV